MAQTNIQNTTTSTMDTTVPDYSVTAKTIDEATSDESVYSNENFTKYLGYYKQIPELKKSVDALAMWTVGKGWTANNEVSTILENITGWGEDSIDSIFWNLIVTKKINGDAYAEIIRDEDTGILINLKPLNPAMVRTIVDKKGIIKRYEHLIDNEWKNIMNKELGID